MQEGTDAQPITGLESLLQEMSGLLSNVSFVCDCSYNICLKVQYTRQDKMTRILNGCLAEIGMRLLVFKSRHGFSYY